MRLLICDQHVVFAESLAHLLTARGYEIVAITHHPDQLIDVLRREPVDVCLLDVFFGADSVVDRLTTLCRASPDTRLVLVTAGADGPLLAAARAAGIGGVVDKREPVTEMLRVLENVAAGRSGIEPERAAPPPVNPARRHANDGVRLASFLTGREREVLCGLVRGEDTNRMARSMGIASATARCHIQNVLMKLGAHSRLEAATSAVRYGLVSPETGAWVAGGEGNPARLRPGG
jgi:two-component system nitrate/nitrite response regulator NarL